MTIQRRWAVAVTGLFSAAFLAYSLVANGGVGGRSEGHGGGNLGGRSPGAGAMHPSSPGGMSAGRQNFNSNSQSMPHGGITGMQGGGMRSSGGAARPDLGLRSGQSAGMNSPNYARTSLQNGPMANRPSFNSATRSGTGDNHFAMSNRPDLGGVSRSGGSAQSGMTRPTGLSPTFRTSNIPGASNPAGSPIGNRPSWSGNQPQVARSNSYASLTGTKPSPESNIPNSRFDLGGNTTGRANTVLKPDIAGPDAPAPGTRPFPNQPGNSRPGGNRPIDNRPGGNQPGDNRPIDNRPGDNRPGDNRPIDNRPGDSRPGDNDRKYIDHMYRPNQNNRPDWSNRPGNNDNRWTGNNWNNNNRNWNSNNRNWSVNNDWTSNRQNIVNNSPTIIGAGYRPGFAVPGYGYGYAGNWGYGQQAVYDNSWQYGPGWAPAYGALHDDWCHGSWTGYSDNSNWLNYAAGAATGWLSNWAFGSRPYSWGYSSYSNPYNGADTVSQTLVGNYDYSQPINTEVAPPPQEQTQPATATLDQARQAFQYGNYDQALALANQVVASLPNDPAVHEFRALALFALARYDEASQALYPALSVGPGWDWTTMSGMYPSEQVYEQQLRALQNYVQGRPNQAAPRFLLAYHYLTLGYNDAAAEQLRQVVQLKPTDGLSRQMLTLLDSSRQQAVASVQLPAEQTTAGQASPNYSPPQTATQPLTQTPPQSTSQRPSQTPPQTTARSAPQTLPRTTTQPPAESAATVQPGQIVGAWTAQPDNKTSIKLTLDRDGKFEWDVARHGPPSQLRGNFTIGDNDLLTLAQDQQGGTLAGNISMTQNDRFTFRLAGAAASDPGLTFVRQL